jgi:hypothetical protein
MIEFMVKVANDERAPLQSRVIAAAHVLDRGLGKPQQSIDLGLIQQRPPEELSDQELLAIASDGPVSDAGS